MRPDSVWAREAPSVLFVLGVALFLALFGCWLRLEGEPDVAYVAHFMAGVCAGVAWLWSNDARAEDERRAVQGWGNRHPAPRDDEHFAGWRRMP